jgi:hypothetical protein
MLTNNGRCTCEIKSRTAMEKAAFKKNMDLFTSKMDLEMRKIQLNATSGVQLYMVLKLGRFGQ